MFRLMTTPSRSDQSPHRRISPLHPPLIRVATAFLSDCPQPIAPHPQAGYGDGASSSASMIEMSESSDARHSSYAVSYTHLTLPTNREV